MTRWRYPGQGRVRRVPVMSRQRAQRRAAAGVLFTTVIAVALEIGVPVAAAPGGNGGQGGHGTTTSSSTSSTSTTMSSTTSSTLPPPTSTTTTSLPPTSIPYDTSPYHFCAGMVHCSLTSHGGAITWSSGGLPGYRFAIRVDRAGVGEVASSGDETGSLETLPGDVVYASASYPCEWGIHPCGEWSLFPSNYGYVLVVNP